MNKRIIKSNDEGGGGAASFNTVVYPGNGGTQEITGVGFQPDLVWTKARTVAYDHGIQDSVRGVNSLLYTSLSQQETITSIATQSFDLDGFTYGSNNKGNASGTNYVAWCWKAAGYANTFNVLENGSTTSSATAAGAGITAGDITTNWSVSANRDAGFSIVTFDGNQVTGETVGHGLSSAPELFIIKRRSAANNWLVMDSNIGQGGYLDLTLAFSTSNYNAWTNNTAPTNSVVTLGGYSYTNGTDMLMYAFHSVAGFSKFGSYEGTGNNGNFVSTSVDGDSGFEPAFLMVKRTENPDNWVIVDNKRGTSNSLFPDDSSQELSNSGAATFSSNGFTVNGASGGWNVLGETYIYMAFANQF